MAFCVLITLLELHVMLCLMNFLKEQSSVPLVEEQRLTCAILISHREKHTSIWIAAGEASKYMSLLTGK